MKMYNNGQRKAMMYGGMSKRKPMMYGGMATTKKKPRKKAQAGGMMTSTMTQNERQNKRMNMNPMMPGMANGGKTMVEVNGKMVPDYAADGKGAKDLRKNMQEGGRAYGKNEMGMINARLEPAIQNLTSGKDDANFDKKLTKAAIKMYVNDIKLAIETGIAKADDPKIKQALRRATK